MTFPSPEQGETQMEIPAEAIEAAAKALYHRDWAGARVVPAWEETPHENAQEYREEAEAAIRAFLDVAGIEIERMDRIIPPELGPPIPEWRYISTWRRVDVS